jgi:hypothetical protein
MRASLLLLSACIVLGSCKKDDPDPVTPTPPAPPVVAALSFTAVNFSVATPYFSTTSGMQQPVDLSTAQGMAGQIDISYIYSGDYGQPGFLAPYTRSKEWYWNNFHQPWLSVADSTQLYATSLTPAQFNSARTNAALMATYFADTSLMHLAPHAIFPTGTCIGGRQSFNPTSVLLQRERVFGFRNHVTGKRGLLFIRNDQAQYWPENIISNATKVDIIREP